MNENKVNVVETRSLAQKEQYEQILRDGVCPFCRENFEKYHKNKILRENEAWLVTQNDHPYTGAKYHFLFVYTKKHILSPDEMSLNDWKLLFELVNWINQEFKIESGSLVMRYGQEGNGSSVRHLHAHVIIGQSTKPTENKLKVKVGYY